MHKVSTNLAYTGPSGEPVLSQSFTLTDKETEVVALHGQIVDEGFGHVEAGVHALSVLPSPDGNFVEWLSGGALSVAANGALTSSDPAVIDWCRAVTSNGAVW